MGWNNICVNDEKKRANIADSNSGSKVVAVAFFTKTFEKRIHHFVDLHVKSLKV